MKRTKSSEREWSVLDTLDASVTWAGETVVKIAGATLDALVQALGLVTGEDLEAIDRSLDRVERRLGRLEARRQERLESEVRGGESAHGDSAEGFVGFVTDARRDADVG